jgi:hypothetical protein
MYDQQPEGQPLPQRLAVLLAKIDELERKKMTNNVFLDIRFFSNIFLVLSA